MKHLVRAMGDEDLGKLIEILRKTTCNRFDKMEVNEILSRRCGANNKESWEQVGVEYFKIVPRKNAVKIADAAYVTQLKNSQYEYVDSIAKDYGRYGLRRSWEIIAPDSVQHSEIDIVFDGPQYQLTIFKGVNMQLTFNNNTAKPNLPKFSQGQLVRIDQLPTATTAYIVGRLLEPNSDVNANPAPDAQRVHIKEKNFEFRLKDQFIKRTQFPLRYNNASTIHKMQGRTCSKIAVQFSSKNDDKDYHSWDKTLPLTIFSRVRNLNDVVIVGNLTKNIKEIQTLMGRCDPFDKFINDRIDRLNALREQNDLLDVIPPLPPSHFLHHYYLPMEDSCGFVLVTVSISMPEVYAVRETASIKSLLYDLNAGNSMDYDAGPRPYTPVCFLWGFPGRGETNGGDRVLLQRNLIEQIKEVETVFSNKNKPFTWETVVRTIEFVFKQATTVTNGNRNIKMYINTPLPTLSKENFEELVKESFGNWYESYIQVNGLFKDCTGQR